MTGGGEEADTATHAAENPEELDAVHGRWITRRHRGASDDDEYPDEWYRQQCGFCRHWFPLAGTLGLDYGACANGESEFDGTVRFEHDGCERFARSGRWSVPSDF
ncbi:DUF3027 domain-containing protein [Kitasatospora sp. NPDC059146]|uniref:DUF3027 domain-containing protein n=1 Tax=Kitasatospora sp. NPDC059146 TaxID=3346741 RepID=UPI0036BB56F0